ncbi:MAG: AAA family ATPase [Planctomycetes bacterium]|nr:AAA family ATPase [Planctomycetota bacterium]
MIPHNVEMEEALLGCPLIDPEVFRQVQGIIRPDDFYIHKNAWVWTAIEDMVEAQQPVDFVTLCDELERREQLDEIGGAAYLTRLINAVPSAIHVKEYARRVNDLADRRRTIANASLLVQAAYNDDGQFGVERAKILANLQKGSTATGDVTGIDEAIDSLYATAEYNRTNPLKAGQVRDLSTGLIDLDRLWGGMDIGLHAISAVTNTGKTAFVLAIAANVARRGERVMYVSPEMTPNQLATRIACAQGRIDSDWIDSGRWPDQKSYTRFIQLMGLIVDWPIDVLTTGDMREIRAQAYRLQPTLIVLDGVERLEGATKEKTHERLGEIADQGAKMAIDRDILVPVLLTAQVATKQVANRRNKAPTLGDVYHTSEIEYIARSVTTLHRDDRWIINKEKTPIDHKLYVNLWKHQTKKRKIPGRTTLRYGDFGDVTNWTEQEVTPDNEEIEF